MEERRRRRTAGKVKSHTRRVRQKIPDEKRAEASYRDLRERSGMGEGAAAAGRTYPRANRVARRGTQSYFLHDAGIEAETLTRLVVIIFVSGPASFHRARSGRRSQRADRIEPFGQRPRSHDRRLPEDQVLCRS